LNFKSEENFDFVFIFHKIEGRTFLLGRNGFYNKLKEKLYKKCFGRVYFCLIFKFQSDEEKFQALDELIIKGDQNELLEFKDENKILFFNEEDFEEELLKCEVFKLSNLYRNFTRMSEIRDNKRELNKEEKNFVEAVIKRHDPIKFKCAIL
jgi:hypothetical protein